MTPDLLGARVDRFVAAVAHWTPTAWAAPAGVAGGPAGSRADVTHALVQRIADLAADAEGQPHRPVPRLDNDLALPDQLRVLAADLLAADPPRPTLEAALAAVRQAAVILPGAR